MEIQGPKRIEVEPRDVIYVAVMVIYSGDVPVVRLLSVHEGLTHVE